MVETSELKRVIEEMKKPNEKPEQQVVERTSAVAAGNEELKREIAKRQRTEAELREHKEILQNIFDHIPIMISFFEDGRLKLVNREWEHTLGWTLEEIRKQNLDILAEVHPDPQEHQKVRDFIDQADYKWMEFNLKRKDGQLINTTWANIKLSDGTSLGFGQDTSERKSVQQSLKLFRSLLDRSSDAIQVIDPDTMRFLDCNESAYQTLGYSREEFLSLSVCDIDPTIDPSRLAQINEGVEKSGFMIFESLHLRKDGSTFLVEVNVKTIRLERDYRLAVVRDITERKRAEEMLQTFPRRLIEVQEAERRRVARELHDEIGQALTGVKINLQNMRCSDDVALHLDESVALIDRALQQVRELSFGLRPSLLDDLGLVAALRWYEDREAQRAGLISEFVADLLETRLPPELETACFRIAQEALTNVVRHAQARRVWVELRQRKAELHLVIRDDGIGFDIHAFGKRGASEVNLGLQGMQERAFILDGNLKISSSPSRGTEIHAWFPLRTSRAGEEKRDW